MSQFAETGTASETKVIFRQAYFNSTMEEYETLKTCPVCLVDYNLKENIPRIFPCQHTVCSPCLRQIINKKHGRSADCPECRRVHHVPDSGFQENRYIVAYLEKLFNKPESKLCEEHGEELKMYCNQCQHTICWMCLLKKHNCYNVDVFAEKLKEERKKIELQADELLRAIDDRLKDLNEVERDWGENDTLLLSKIENDRDRIKSKIDFLFNKIRENSLHKSDKERKEISDKKQILINDKQDISVQKERAKDSDDFLQYKHFFSTIEVQPNPDYLTYTNVTYTPLSKNECDLTVNALIGKLNFNKDQITIDPIKRGTQGKDEKRKLTESSDHRTGGSRKRSSSSTAPNADAVKHTRYPNMLEEYRR